MPFSERIIGFSTGAIAKGDFRRALDALTKTPARGVELSALRQEELPALAGALKDLDLHQFEYVSVHAPTRFDELKEDDAVRLLQSAVSRGFPVVVHPDAIHSMDLWRSFGSLLLIENMDKRKPIGRSAAELKESFAALPEAGLCFDVAHARQVDPSMIESQQILRDFKDRIREVHASGVTTRSVHGAISRAAGSAYGSVAHLIPENVPIILESPVEEAMIAEEIDFARNTFSPWLKRLCTDIDDVLDLKVESLRKYQAENFFRVLQTTRITLRDFEGVISHLPTGGPYNPGDVLFSTHDLLDRLSESEKAQLKEHLLRRVRDLAREYPDLRSEFREQFANV
jgi:hypothetical protein